MDSARRRGGPGRLAAGRLRRAAGRRRRRRQRPLPARRRWRSGRPRGRDPRRRAHARAPPAAALADEPTWVEDPHGQRNWRFQYHALRWLRPVKAAYDETGQHAYLDRYLELLRDWWEHNQHGEAADEFAWNDHAAAHRALVYACAADAVPGEDWLDDVVAAHGRRLADEDFYVETGNHALNQSIGLLSSACHLGREDWQDTAVERLGELVVDSVNERGVTDEQAIAYQLYNHEHYSAAIAHLQACGLDGPEPLKRVERMPELLAHATMAEGRYAMIGDTEDDPARPIAGTVAEFAATAGERGPQPEARSALYPDEGYRFGRTGWGGDEAFADERHYSLRFGPARRPRLHGHHDGGSLTLAGYGRRLIADTGKYAYESDAWREHVRSRAAHSVVVADREHQPGPTRLLAADDGDEVERTVVAGEPYDGVELTRTVAFLRPSGALLVVDEVRADGPVELRQLWQLPDGADPVVENGVVRTRFDRGNVAIQQHGEQPEISVEEGREDPPQGWISRQYGEMAPAPTVEARQSGPEARYVTLLVPYETAAPEASVAEDDDSYVVTIGDQQHRVARSPAPEAP